LRLSEAQAGHFDEFAARTFDGIRQRWCSIVESEILANVGLLASDTSQESLAAMTAARRC
jgi:hypothetical protein